MRMLLVLVIACKSERAPAPASPSPQPIADAAASAPDAPALTGFSIDKPGARFDCAAFVPTTRAKCPPVPAAAKTLVAVAADQAHVVAVHDETLKAPHWARARTALDAIAKLDPKPLAAPVRIAVQNAALRISFDGPADVAGIARREVARFALPAAELARIGSEPTLEEWLGPRAQWQTRHRNGQPALHGLIGPHAHYRMLQGKVRSVAHQLIAIDTDGKPHVTSVVGELEMRASNENDSAACVVKLDLDTLCGTSAGLAPIAATHPITHFFVAQPGGMVACNACHDASTFPVLAADLVRAHDEREFAVSLERVTEKLKDKLKGAAD